MELINKIRKSRKGFTLIEIIVVLVILAILAAFTIPSMLGFVGDAKSKAYLAEAQAVYTAAQGTATEYFAKGKGSSITTDSLNSAGVSTAGATDKTPAKTMKDFLDIDINPVASEATTVSSASTDNSGNAFWTVSVDPDTGKVSSVRYVRGGYDTTVYGDGKDPITKKYVAPSSTPTT